MADRNGAGSLPTQSDRRPRAAAASTYDTSLAIMRGLDGNNGDDNQRKKGDATGDDDDDQSSAGGGDDDDQQGDDRRQPRRSGDDSAGNGEGDNQSRGGDDDDQDNGGGDNDQGDDSKSRKRNNDAGDGADSRQREDGEDDRGDAGDDDSEEDGNQNGPNAAELKKLAHETRQFLNAKLKDLPPETRKLVGDVIHQRMSKVLTAHTAEKEGLEQRVADVTGELEAAQRAKGPTVVPGVHAALLADSEADINEIESDNEEFLDWADRYRDGFNLPESEKYDESKPSYTAEDIRQRARQVRRENDRILPQARQNLKDRATHDAKLRKVLPAIFDSKTAEYRAAHVILRELPQLKQYPDFRVRVARMVLGEKALAELLKQKEQTPGQGKNKQGQSQDRRAPRLPGSGGPAKGGGSGSRPGGSGAPAALKNFGKDPTSRNLASAIEKML